jgi:hypothetical protein
LTFIFSLARILTLNLNLSYIGEIDDNAKEAESDEEKKREALKKGSNVWLDQNSKNDTYAAVSRTYLFSYYFLLVSKPLICDPNFNPNSNPDFNPYHDPNCNPYCDPNSNPNPNPNSNPNFNPNPTRNFNSDFNSDFNSYLILLVSFQGADAANDELKLLEGEGNG